MSDTPGQPAANRSTAQLRHPVDSAQHRILVIETNRDLADNLCELLEEPANCPIALTQASAIDAQLKSRSFDLALVDVDFAWAEGTFHLLDQLREQSRYGEIILMTGYATLDTALDAIRSGIYALIQKPFDTDDLLALTGRALAQVALKRDKDLLTTRLTDSEHRYRGVVDTTPACILGLNTDGNIVLSNPFARSCVGRDAGSIAGKSLSHYCGETEDSVALAKLCASFDHSQSEIRVEVEAKRTDLQPRRIMWTISSIGEANDPSEAPGPQTARLLAVGQDVTEQRELERKNAESEALAAMGTLTTGLAHEIRNPLNAARLQLELLQRRTSKYLHESEAEQIKQPAAIVNEELTRLSSLLDDFLHLARPRELEMRQLQVSDLLDSVRRLEEPVAAQDNVTIASRVLPQDLTIAGDIDKLKQVLINLVDNALSALREKQGGAIQMEATLGERGSVVIEITDDGPGLPDNESRVFQPFVTGTHMGTGLGLTIVRRIVERHGGMVSLNPNPDGGTIARIMLPKRDP